MFDYISDGNSIKMSKPNPEVFLNASKALSIKPENCIVVEDAVSEIDAANSCGMISVGLGPASEYKETKIKIKDIIELKTIL